MELLCQKQKAIFHPAVCQQKQKKQRPIGSSVSTCPPASPPVSAPAALYSPASLYYPAAPDSPDYPDASNAPNAPASPDASDSLGAPKPPDAPDAPVVPDPVTSASAADVLYGLVATYYWWMSVKTFKYIVPNEVGMFPKMLQFLLVLAFFGRNVSEKHLNPAYFHHFHHFSTLSNSLNTIFRMTRLSFEFNYLFTLSFCINV